MWLKGGRGMPWDPKTSPHTWCGSLPSAGTYRSPLQVAGAAVQPLRLSHRSVGTGQRICCPQGKPLLQPRLATGPLARGVGLQGAVDL